MTQVPHIPVLRQGRAYESLDVADVTDPCDGRVLGRLSQANAGLIQRDAAQADAAAAALRRVPVARLLEICRQAGELFLHADLPLSAGATQSPGQYVEALSASSGLPQTLVRRNMAKVHHVLTQMPAILAGLTRGLDPAVLDAGVGTQGGLPVSFFPVAASLGVVLPSNSPGVNSIWLPAVALKMPVVVKPGREEPWTPWRIIQALLTAGLPAPALSFYPTDHEGSAAILRVCSRAILFGDDQTTAAYAGSPAVQVHGAGRSKVLLGQDEVDRWPRHLDVLVASVADNGGRSCVNASTIVAPRHGRAIAEALAERLAAIEPRPLDDPEAQLAAFARPAVAQAVDAAIEQGLAAPGARDVTAAYRPPGTPRLATLAGRTFLRPTLVWCDALAHPLANREFLFPYAAVVEAPQERMLATIGPSLVVTAITGDPAFRDALVRCPWIDRLNLGPVPTSSVQWDQPHEGNLFEFLYRRRAIACAAV